VVSLTGFFEGFFSVNSFSSVGVFTDDFVIESINKIMTAMARTRSMADSSKDSMISPLCSICFSHIDLMNLKYIAQLQSIK